MAREELTVDIGSATGVTAATDVSDMASPYTVYISGVTGGGNVAIEVSGNKGTTFQTYQGAIIGDDYFTIADLFDQIRFNVTTAKAGAKADIRMIRQTL